MRPEEIRNEVGREKAPEEDDETNQGEQVLLTD